MGAVGDGAPGQSADEVADDGPRNLLELLPDEFTLEEARILRQKMGKSTEKNIKMIRNWVNRNYVIQNSEFSFIKSERFKLNSKN